MDDLKHIGLNSARSENSGTVLAIHPLDKVLLLGQGRAAAMAAGEGGVAAAEDEDGGYGRGRGRATATAAGVGGGTVWWLRKIVTMAATEDGDGRGQGRRL